MATFVGAMIFTQDIFGREKRVDPDDDLTPLERFTDIAIHHLTETQTAQMRYLVRSADDIDGKFVLVSYPVRVTGADIESQAARTNRINAFDTIAFVTLVSQLTAESIHEIIEAAATFLPQPAVGETPVGGLVIYVAENCQLPRWLLPPQMLLEIIGYAGIQAGSDGPIVVTDGDMVPRSLWTPRQAHEERPIPEWCNIGDYEAYLERVKLHEQMWASVDAIIEKHGSMPTRQLQPLLIQRLDEQGFQHARYWVRRFLPLPPPVTSTATVREALALVRHLGTNDLGAEQLTWLKEKAQTAVKLLHEDDHPDSDGPLEELRAFLEQS